MLVALWPPCVKFWSSPKWRPGWCNFGPCHCNHYQSMSLLMIMILLTWQNNDKLCSNKRYWLPVISRKQSIREPDYKLILQFSCFHVNQVLGNVNIRLSLKQAFLYTYNKQVLPKESTLRHHLHFEHHHGVKELLLWSILLNIEKIEREGKYCHPYPIRQDLHVTTVICLTSMYWIPGGSMQLPFFLIWSTYSDIDFWSSYSSSSRLFEVVFWRAFAVYPLMIVFYIFL